MREWADYDSYSTMIGNIRDEFERDTWERPNMANRSQGHHWVFRYINHIKLCKHVSYEWLSQDITKSAHFHDPLLNRSALGSITESKIDCSQQRLHETRSDLP